MLDSGKCAVCGQPIVWARTISGNPVPINPDPVAGGDLLIIGGVVQPPLGAIIETIYGPTPRFASHVRTCPKRQEAEKAAQKLREGKGK